MAAESPIEHCVRPEAVVDRFGSITDIVGGYLVMESSPDKGLSLKFIYVLRKFKLLCGAQPVYAYAMGAGRVAQLCPHQGFCL